MTMLYYYMDSLFYPNYSLIIEAKILFHSKKKKKK